MPNAVDTNVLVRFLVDDGSGQVGIARRVFDRGAVFVPASVMLESEWVLRSGFGVDKERVCEAFSRILNMTGVTIEQADMVSQAVEAHRSGMEFADALHLFSSSECGAFYTFDTDFRRSAKRLPEAITVLSPETA
jgi:predicted nucleic-acid-binding protein